MFEEEEIMEFFNRIINTNDIREEEITTNITKFYEYLELTKMCDDNTLSKLEIIIQCFQEIMSLRKAVGYFDVKALIKGKEQVKTKPKEKAKKPKETKHYNHYESSNLSSSCGSVSYTGHC